MFLHEEFDNTKKRADTAHSKKQLEIWDNSRKPKGSHESPRIASSNSATWR